MIEEVLNKKVKHFCYPWGEGSDWAVKLSRKVGYVSNYWGSYHNTEWSISDQNHTFYLPRLSADFIMTLPGNNRKE